MAVIPPMCLIALMLGQSFEVTSVKLNKSSGGRPLAEFSPSGERFSATNMPLGGLIGIAYAVSARQVSPIEPILSETFDIQAKADHAVGRDEMLRMALLADRFSLTVRREQRELPAYALTIGKNGPNLHLSPESLPWTSSRAGGIEPRSGRIVFKNESMPDLASALTKLNVIGRMVVDKTGLTGNYDFELNFTPPERPGDSPSDAPSIFTAIQEQLGLKLEPQKAQVDFLIIEHVQNPTEN